MKWLILILFIGVFMISTTLAVDLVSIERNLGLDAKTMDLINNPTYDLRPETTPDQSRVITTRSDVRGKWKVILTGNESVWVKEATIDQNNRLRLEPAPLIERIIEVCELGRREDSVVCKYQIVEVPSSLKVREDKQEEPTRTISKEFLTERYTLQLDENVREYKLGDSSIHVVQNIQTSGDTSDVICEAGYCRSNLSTTAPYDDLVLYWNFDIDDGTTSYDFTDNSKDGTYTGGNTRQNGLYNAYSNFSADGSNDRIDFGNTGIILNDSFTVSAWINHANQDNGVWDGCILCQSYMQFGIPASSMEGMGLLIEGDVRGNQAYISTYWEGGPGFTNTSSRAFTTIGVPQNQWNMVTVTKNSSSVCAWLNGGSRSCTANPSGYTYRASDLGTFMIGTNPDTILYNEDYNGSVDEVMVFTTDLTETQINNIYQNQSSRFKNTGTLGIGQFLINLTSANPYSKVNVSNQALNTLSSNVSLQPCFNGLVCSNAQNVTGGNLSFTTAGFGNTTLNYTLLPSSNNFYTPYINGSSVLSYTEMGDGNVTTCRTLNVSGGNYTLLNDINSTVRCIDIEANSVHFDLGGYRIIGDTVDNDRGINNLGYNYSTITNGRIENYSRAIDFSNNRNSNFSYLNITYYNVTTFEGFFTTYIGIALSTSNNNEIKNVNITGNITDPFQQTGNAYGIYQVSSSANNSIYNSSVVGIMGDSAHGLWIQDTKNSYIYNVDSKFNINRAILFSAGSNTTIVTSNFSNNPTQDIAMTTTSLNNTFLNTSYITSIIIVNSELIREWYLYFNTTKTDESTVNGINISGSNYTNALQFSELSSNGGNGQVVARAYVNTAGTFSNYTPYNITATYPFKPDQAINGFNFSQSETLSFVFSFLPSQVKFILPNKNETVPHIYLGKSKSFNSIPHLELGRRTNV